ncbi:MAG: Glutathione peroxidase [Microbacteriaceae bacterium]|nr:Glutathione peroxidase [Microbacteriaceae bacterium]
MTMNAIPLITIDGEVTSLAAYEGQVVLVVNVASKCGNTPQYAKLEELQRSYGARGFTVLGFPCNQFAGQEPGSSDDIKAFCALNYGITFPLFEKSNVNGRKRHPLYEELAKTPDVAGKAGDIQWNFEKFLIGTTGRVQRFRPRIQPDSAEIVGAIEAALSQRIDRAAS